MEVIILIAILIFIPLSKIIIKNFDNKKILKKIDYLIFHIFINFNIFL